MLIRLRTLNDERGNALVLAVFLLAALALISITLVNAVRGDSTRSAQGVHQDASLQAAEAGIGDYVGKLLVDNQFFLHDVAAGESTRCSGSQRVSSTPTDFVPWSLGTSWTYCNGKDNWRPAQDKDGITNGYEYNIQVSPPSVSQPWADIVTTARKLGTTGPVYVLEERVRPSSVADFQMLANADITYGSDAVTRGKVYVGIDSNGRAHSVTYQSGSEAYADVYAEGQVYGNPMVAPAKAYDSDSNPNIRSVIKQPVSFTSFASSLTTIQSVASTDNPSMSFDNSSKDAWQLTFNSNGTFSIQSCDETYTTNSWGQKTYYPVNQRAPTCGTATTYNVPTKGAIYTAQTAIISKPSSASIVNGQVTVASNDDVVVAGNLRYASTGDDVLGLIAKNNVLVAQWAPCPLDWRAATIAQTGYWKSSSGSTTCNYGNGSSTFAMTFTGSSATNLGGSMGQFSSRQYNYDTSLSYLDPPWFPTIDFGYTVLLFRELPPS